MPEHKRIKPEIGKWYVSDIGPTKRRSLETKVKPDRSGGRSHRILSGSFETEAEAEQAAAKLEKVPGLKDRTHIWQAMENE